MNFLLVILVILVIVCLFLTFIFIGGIPFIGSVEIEAGEANKSSSKASKASPANSRPSKPSKSTSPASQSSSSAGAAEMLRAEAEAKKAEADVKKAEADVRRAEAEAKRVELEGIKAEDEKRRFYFDFAYRILLLIAAIGVLIWLIPQIQEISLPWGSGTFSAKRAHKEAIAAGAGNAKPPMPQPSQIVAQAAQVAQAAKVLKETLEPGPSADRIVDKLEETEAYQAVGVAKDAIYMCHRARKIPRSEYHRVYIYLDADEPSIIDKVEKVAYRLHPTFAQREITQTDRRRRFQLEITAWGEFMLYALVYFKDVAKPVQLKRYLNF